ncbi:unnamed protein product [Lota lota]
MGFNRFLSNRGRIFSNLSHAFTFLLWNNEVQATLTVHDVHYNVRINGDLKKAPGEIDTQNPQERFPTGSGEEEAVEIHDFQTGITGLRFFRGEKCYIKPHIKASPPDLGGYTERLAADLGATPARLDEDPVIWVAAERPMRATRFLGARILALCGDAPVHWLHPTRPRDGERKRRGTRRAKRQTPTEEFGEAAAGRRNPRARPAVDKGRGAVAVGEEERGDKVVGAVVLGEEEGGDGGESGTSTAGSAYNPENPYHAGEKEAVTFDPMLDHLGICCSECRRSYTHCQRVCEPLRGYWPWPYNHAGCRVVCRVVLPCRWWVARMLGIV